MIQPRLQARARLRYLSFPGGLVVGKGLRRVLSAGRELAEGAEQLWMSYDAYFGERDRPFRSIVTGTPRCEFGVISAT